MADCHHRGAFQPPARRCRGEGAVGLQEKLPEADLNLLARIEIAGGIAGYAICGGTHPQRGPETGGGAARRE